MIEVLWCILWVKQCSPKAHQPSSCVHSWHEHACTCTKFDLFVLQGVATRERVAYCATTFQSSCEMAQRTQTQPSSGRTSKGHWRKYGPDAQVAERSQGVTLLTLISHLALRNHQRRLRGSDSCSSWVSRNIDNTLRTRQGIEVLSVMLSVVCYAWCDKFATWDWFVGLEHWKEIMLFEVCVKRYVKHVALSTYMQTWLCNEFSEPEPASLCWRILHGRHIPFVGKESEKGEMLKVVAK